MSTFSKEQQNVCHMVQNRLCQEEGQGLVEYALIILFIAITLVGVVAQFGAIVLNFYTGVNSNFPG